MSTSPHPRVGAPRSLASHTDAPSTPDSNYAAHIKELNNTAPTEPFFFLKPTSSYVVKNGPVEVPQGVDVHHEGTPVLVQLSCIADSLTSS